ncbi:MAG: fluoride efflux transporter CrcB [Chloroflexi bacterium]|nr:fluoride efflux transporter CrcB [Chloroflexota bacterium]
MVLVVIGLGGAAGAVARYLVDGLVTQQAASAFPFGTLVINLSGSLVLGVLFALAIERNVLPADIRAPVMVGFLGAYTTFSTLMLQSWLLVESGAIGMAILNVVGSSLLGLLAVLLGLGIGRALA